MAPQPERSVVKVKKVATGLGKSSRIFQDKNCAENSNKTMKCLHKGNVSRHSGMCSAKPIQTATNVTTTTRNKAKIIEDTARINTPCIFTIDKTQAGPPKNKTNKYKEEKNQKNKRLVNTTKQRPRKNVSRREQLELWRAEKGRSKKENCHPLLSRKRPLCKIVASPSYQAFRLNHSRALEKIAAKKQELNRRHTLVCQKEEKLKLKVDRRKTISTMISTKHKMTPYKKEMKPEVNQTMEQKTPWQNKGLSMRQRLDLWMEAKGKTPHRTPHKSPHFIKRKSFINIPQTNKQETETKCTTDNQGNPKTEDLNTTFTLDEDRDEAVVSVKDELEKLLQQLNQNVDEDIIQSDLDLILKSYPDAIHHADYWICKARLAAIENDVQRVVCLLEQAYTFDAKPENKIKEEIVAFLQRLNDDNNKEEEGDTDVDEDYFTKYAITPGRRVHFAVNTMSPLQFKSSIIRFCIIESKSFKKRLNAQIKRKIMTPVRRSVRLQNVGLPEFLQSNDVFINSPSQVEDKLIDGEISFKPNKTIQTPLNNGWVLRDERIDCSSPIEGNKEMELSFM